MPKHVPKLPGIPPSRYPFSEVVEANGFVFLAGVTALAEDFSVEIEVLAVR